MPKLQVRNGLCLSDPKCATGVAFVIQFFLCRVLASNYILWWTLQTALTTPEDKVEVQELLTHCMMSVNVRNFMLYAGEGS